MLVTWDGWLEKEPVPDGEERRIIVREYEIHATDADSDDPFGAVEQQEFEVLFFHGSRPVRTRLVYADSLPY